MKAHMTTPNQSPARLHETDIYDFAGWLTTRPGVMEVGSTRLASPMAEAVGEYIKTFPERFAPAPAPAVPQGWRKQRMANWPHSEPGMRLIGFVVPDDGQPLAMVSERLAQIIESPAAPSQEPAVPQGAFLSITEGRINEIASRFRLLRNAIPFAREIEHEFRSMLAAAPSQEPAPEPVTLTDEQWRSLNDLYSYLDTTANALDPLKFKYAAYLKDIIAALRSKQPEPVTLTDDELIDAWNSVEPPPDSTENVLFLRMRAIIAAMREKSGGV